MTDEHDFKAALMDLKNPSSVLDQNWFNIAEEALERAQQAQEVDVENKRMKQALKDIVNYSAGVLCEKTSGTMQTVNHWASKALQQPEKGNE